VLEGQGTSATVVQAAASPETAGDRVISVSAGVTATIRDLTLRHGYRTGSPAQGGGMYNDGNLTLSAVRLAANVARGDYHQWDPGCGEGGAIYTNGTLSMDLCMLDGNQAYGGDGPEMAGRAYGGGIYNNGTLNVTGSTLDANLARGGNVDGEWGFEGGEAMGGGIYNAMHKDMVITASTVSNNESRGGDSKQMGGFSQGGGITDCNVGGDSGSITIVNCTITANAANGGNGNMSPGGAYGGGVKGGETEVNIISSTVAFNSCNYNGGGVYSATGWNDQGPTLKNCILCGNQATYGGQDICNNVQSRGYNLVCDVSGGNLDIDGPLNTGEGNITGQDAQLQPLADNGGPTLTHAIQEGSPALDAGTGSGTPDTDQRGVSRPQGDAYDMGAYELIQSTPTPLPTDTPEPIPTPTATDTPSLTPTLTATFTPTLTATMSPTCSPTASPTSSPSPTNTLSPTITTTPTVTPSPTPAPVPATGPAGAALLIVLMGIPVLSGVRRKR
ncbi:hypothetical protein JW905_01890, partial [bacterium]|nr:hypothetical protein [candidate division CSSED10-310 bacterium]